MPFSADQLDDLRARSPIADVLSSFGVRSRGKGRVRWAPCPFHGGRGYTHFKIDDGRGFFKCFSCGEAGDVFKAVQRLKQCTFPEAVEFLGGAREIAPEDRRRIEQRRKAQEYEDRREDARGIAGAQKLFRNGLAFKGSPAEVYLLSRGIIPFDGMDVDLRFAPAAQYRGFKSKQETEKENLGDFPAMLAAIRDPAGDIIGVHRTYLDGADPAIKFVPPGDVERNRRKKILGNMGGGMIRLSPPGSTLVIGEGIETSVSAYQLGIGGKDAAVAAAVSLGNLAGGAESFIPHPKFPDDKGKTIPNGVPDHDRPGMELPNDVDHVIIIGDGDSDPVMTRAQVHVAGLRFRDLERSVEVAFAPMSHDMNDLLAEARKGHDVATPIPVAFEHFSADVQSLVQPVRKSRYGRLPFNKLDEPGPELSYIVDDVVTANEKFVIAGPSQSGKSFLAIDIGMAIATGRPFFGHQVLRPGLIVYQAGEGARGIKGRLRAYRDFHNLPGDVAVPFELLQSPIDLYAPNGDTAPLIEEIKWICEDYPKLELRAVFIDTLSTAQGAADENSGKDMGAIMQNLDKIRRATGASVGLVHHMNAAGNKLRGHTSIFANVDQVIAVTHNEESGVREAYLSKNKDGETGLISKFELTSVVIGKRDDQKDLTSCVCTVLGEKAAARTAAREGMSVIQGERLFKVMQTLVEAIKVHGVPATDLPREASRAPAWADVVRLADWRAEAARKEAREKDDTDEKVQARIWKRFHDPTHGAVDKLARRGLLGHDNGYVWRTKRRIAGIDKAEGAAKVAFERDTSADPEGAATRNMEPMF